MYPLRPKTADLARYGDLLAQHYVTSRQAVFGFIATPSRLSIKRFADAFSFERRQAMIPTAVYLLCMVTSTFCAVLLVREYRRTSARLLFWSSLSFVVWAVNNALVFADLIVFPDANLSLMRALTSLAAVSLLLYGLVWDAA